MKIAVGSTNPVKVAAVRSAVLRVWRDAEIEAVDVASGIAAMPLSEAETIRGAYNRALLARRRLAADLGVGLEAGVQALPQGLMLHGWVVIVDKDERQSLGGTARLPLPPAIADRVLAGEELGPVMDDLLGENDVKRKGGAIGALTAGLVLRQESFVTAVAYALAPFVSPHFYQE